MLSALATKRWNTGTRSPSSASDTPAWLDPDGGAFDTRAWLDPDPMDGGRLAVLQTEVPPTNWWPF